MITSRRLYRVVVVVAVVVVVVVVVERVWQLKNVPSPGSATQHSKRTKQSKVMQNKLKNKITHKIA